MSLSGSLGSTPPVSQPLLRGLSDLPKAHQLKRGRPRKFRFGQLVRKKDDGRIYAVVGYGRVDHPHARESTHKYRTVEYRTAWRMRIGRASWLWPYEMEAIESDAPAFGDDRQGRAVYRANRRLGGRRGRGCDCQCCAHIALPPGMVADTKFDPFEQYVIDAETVKSRKALARETLRLTRERQAEEAAQSYED